MESDGSPKAKPVTNTAKEIHHTHLERVRTQMRNTSHKWQMMTKPIQAVTKAGGSLALQ